MVRGGAQQSAKRPAPGRGSGRKSNRRYVMVEVVCPSCGGAKVGYRITCSDRGCRLSEITCDFCKGAGQVSSETERWHRGDARRKERVERGLTLSEQAAILGVAPMVLYGMYVLNPKLVLR